MDRERVVPAQTVVVREGRIEVLAGQRSFLVREGEQAAIEAGEWPRVGLTRAEARAQLELWARQLEDEAAGQ